MKEALGIVAAFLAIAQSVPYTIDIFRRKTKPHIYTFLIWSIVTGLAFAGQVVAGGGPGAWTTGVMTVLTVLTFLLCFKYGTDDITAWDAVFLIGALIAIVPWWLTKDPLWSVLIATLIDVLAFIPTIRKTYNDPTSETLISYISNLVRHPLSILALATYSVTTVVYPATLFMVNVILVSGIIIRRRNLL